MEHPPQRNGDGLAVLVLGNDTLIEALPARPIQLAHACGRAGYDLVVPLSWGDELVAGAALSELGSRPAGPAVMCSCALVRQRLLRDGMELAPSLVSLVASPVALSRQLRASLGQRLRSLAFAGRCPSARPPEYDLTLDPAELLAHLASRGIAPDAEPDLFVDTIPPDRRRHLSVPGGCPRPDVLWHQCNERVLVQLDSANLAVDLSQLLLSRESLLVDVAPALGCACSGVTTATTGRQARIAVTSLEPPQAPAPIIEPQAGIELTMPIGQIRRTAPARDPRLDPGGEAEERPPRTPMAVTPASALRVVRPVAGRRDEDD